MSSYGNIVINLQILIKFWHGLCASLKSLKSSYHLVRMTVEALVMRKCYNFLAVMKKRVVQWYKAKINSSFLSAIMENRFHKLFFISLKYNFQELFISSIYWLSYWYGYFFILMPKLGPFPSVKVAELWLLSTQIYYRLPTL